MYSNLKNKTVYICTLGCKVNQYESDAMLELLKDEGVTSVGNGEYADIYIINTCSVTNMADKKSRQMISRMRRLNPNAIIVATGCYIQATGDELVQKGTVDLIIGNNRKKDVARILDEYISSNVVVDNGKVADYDESKIVLGYAVPGLGDNLHKTLKTAQEYLNKVDLPDQFTISADVENCTMSMGLIIATSNLADFNIKDSIDLSNIKSKINKLQAGADALVDGANQLSDGSQKLATASPKIKKGTSDLHSGLKKLKKGAKKNHKGNKKFHKELKKGLSSAQSGAKKLADGANELAKGAKSVNDGAKKVNKGAGDLDAGSKDLTGGIAQIINGFEKKDGINEGSNALKKGAKDANDGVKQFIDMLQSTPGTLDDQIASIMSQVKEASGGQITSEAQLNGLIEGINAAVKGGTPLETAVATQGLNVSTYYSLLQAYYSIKTLNNVKQSISSLINDHAEEIKQLSNGMDSLESGSSDLAKGLYQAYLGLNSLSKGASSLSDGTGALKDGTNTLSKGTQSLKDGADTLNQGVITLYNGVKVMKVKIGAASPQLVEASGTLAKAIKQACDGSKTLADGTATFCNGIDTLADGTKTLKDGAQKLNEEGIRKITSLFGDKAEKAIDKIQNLLDAGSSYKSFGGISKDMDGQVKFIYKTPEIGERE